MPEIVWMSPISRMIPQLDRVPADLEAKRDYSPAGLRMQ